MREIEQISRRMPVSKRHVFHGEEALYRWDTQADLRWQAGISQRDWRLSEYQRIVFCLSSYQLDFDGRYALGDESNLPSTCGWGGWANGDVRVLAAQQPWKPAHQRIGAVQDINCQQVDVLGYSQTVEMSAAERRSTDEDCIGQVAYP
jgi:hypothetical protein